MSGSPNRPQNLQRRNKPVQTAWSWKPESPLRGVCHVCVLTRAITQQMCSKLQQTTQWPSSEGGQRQSYFTPQELVNPCSEQESRGQTNMTPSGICSSGRHILSLHKQGKTRCIYLRHFISTAFLNSSGPLN